jgi:hypothetical protein
MIPSSTARRGRLTDPAQAGDRGDHTAVVTPRVGTRSKKAATKASKELRNRNSMPNEKTVAGSDFAQAKKSRTPKKSQR